MVRLRTVLLTSTAMNTSLAKFKVLQFYVTQMFVCHSKLNNSFVCHNTCCTQTSYDACSTAPPAKHTIGLFLVVVYNLYVILEPVSRIIIGRQIAKGLKLDAQRVVVVYVCAKLPLDVLYLCTDANTLAVRILAERTS